MSEGEVETKISENLETKENLLSLFKANANDFKDELLMSAPQEKTNFLKNSIMSKIRERKKLKNQNPTLEDVQKEEVVNIIKKVESKSETDSTTSEEEILDFESSDSSEEENEEEEDGLKQDFVKLTGFETNWKNVPWLQESVENISKHPNVQLHEEIIQFYKFLEPTKLEMEHRKDVISRLKALLKRVHSNAKLQIFGSYAT